MTPLKPCGRNFDAPYSNCSMMPAWQHYVPMSGFVEESEKARKLPLYATSSSTTTYKNKNKKQKQKQKRRTKKTQTNKKKKKEKRKKKKKKKKAVQRALCGYLDHW